MQKITIALGLDTALDIATARQLHDYGKLDDAGVASALEQMGLQQGVTGGRPAYLTRLQRVALVIDNGDDIILAAFEAEDVDEERGMLASLFALMPESAGQIVAWDNGDWELLLQRAFCHALQAPAALRDWPRQALRRLFAGADRAADQAVQADVIRLYGNPVAAQEAFDPALRAAVHWHAMAVRWRCVTGELDSAAQQLRLQRVAARVATLHTAHSASSEWSGT